MKDAINELIRESHETAVGKGWWEQPRTFGDQVALMHSELSEALEEFRNPQKIAGDILEFDPLTTIYVTLWGKPATLATAAQLSNAPLKPEGVAAEFADVLIRIFDTCGRYHIPLAEALELKLAYNRTRPHRHGGKRL